MKAKILGAEGAILSWSKQSCSPQIGSLEQEIYAPRTNMLIKIAQLDCPLWALPPIAQGNTILFLRTWMFQNRTSIIEAGHPVIESNCPWGRSYIAPTMYLIGTSTNNQ